MTIETQDDVVALKRIGSIVSLVLQRMLDAAEPGMTTRELDSLGERLLAGSARHEEPGHIPGYFDPSHWSSRHCQ